MLKVKIAVLVIFCYSIIIGQSNSVALYFDGENIFSNSIEDIVERIDNKEFRITRTTNLNRVFLNEEIKEDVYNVISKSDNRLNVYSDVDLMAINAVKNELLSHDLFLYVHTISIANFVQFQFSLFSTTKTIEGGFNSKNSFHIPKVLNLLHKTDFALDLNKNDWPVILRNEVIRLFPHLNVKPISKISSGQPIFADTIYFWTKDTLTLNSKESRDFDTDPIYWEYNWRQINVERYPLGSERTLLLNKFEPVQNIQFMSPGNYHIGLNISDGIDFSIEDTIVIVVVERPNILVDKPNRVFFEYKSIFRNLKKTIIHKENYFVAISKNDIVPDSFNLVVKGDSSKLSDVISNYKAERFGIEPRFSYYTRNNKYGNILKLSTDFKGIDSIEYVYKAISKNVSSNKQIIRVVKRKRGIASFKTGVLYKDQNLYQVVKSGRDAIIEDSSFYSVEPFIELGIYLFKFVELGFRIQTENSGLYRGSFFEDNAFLRPRLRLNIPIKGKRFPTLFNVGIGISNEPVLVADSSSGCNCLSFDYDLFGTDISDYMFGFNFEARIMHKNKWPLYVSIEYSKSFNKIGAIAISDQIHARAKQWSFGLTYNFGAN